MKDYGTGFLETEALAAILAEDEGTAGARIREMSREERRRLSTALTRLNRIVWLSMMKED